MPIFNNKKLDFNKDAGRINAKLFIIYILLILLFVALIYLL